MNYCNYFIFLVQVIIDLIIILLVIYGTSMIVINHNRDILTELHSLKSFANKPNKSGLIQIIKIAISHFYSYKSLLRINKRLKEINILVTQKKLVDKDVHETIKETLFELQKVQSDSVDSLFSRKKFNSLLAENISLAYKIEKKVRKIRFSNLPAKPASDLTKAVSSLSLATTAKKI